MAISTFETKFCGQKLCAQKDGFRKSGHIYGITLAMTSFIVFTFFLLPSHLLNGTQKNIKSSYVMT